MQLSLNQFLLLVLTFTAVVVAVLLVRFLAQLRRTAAEGERTMAEVRRLVEKLNELDGLVKERVVELGEFMEASRKTASNLAEASFILTTRVLAPGSRYWRLLFPVAAFLWKKFKKRKEKKNG
jgi:cytochrome c-type biogenesis protein CcmH/NrfG